jgi:hypothetical protein
VGCLSPSEPVVTADPRLDKRVSVDVRAASASAVLDVAARAAGLSGAEVKAKDEPKVTVTLENARLGTLMAAIADATGLSVSVEGDRIVAVKR